MKEQEELAEQRRLEAEAYEERERSRPPRAYQIEEQQRNQPIPPPPITPPVIVEKDDEIQPIEEDIPDVDIRTEIQPPTQYPTQTRQREREVQTPPRERERSRVREINPDLPKISIIVDDFGGIGNSLFERFNALDKAIAFAVLPDLNNSRRQMESAVAAGREVLIHLPMEPENSNQSQEPNTITTAMSDFDIRVQVETWMYKLPFVVGVNNHMGSKASQDDRVLSAIMSTIRQNNLFFIDSATTSNSRIGVVARNHGILTNSRDIFLDVPDTSIQEARRKIDEIKRMRNRDVIIVITHCHSDAHYRQLVNFIERLKDEGYELIPPSKAVR